MVDRSPRLITREAAANYCGLSLAGLDSWIDRGLLPGPLPGTKRYDLKAIDRAIDKLSGIDDARPTTDLDDWIAGRNARSAQGHPHGPQ